MGRKPIPDQLLREILRLRSQGKSFRAIAAICGVGRTTAQDYYRLARSKGLDWNDVKHRSNVKLKTELQSPKLKPSAYDEPDLDRYSKLLYLRRIRGIDDAYNYYCEEDGDGKKYSRASFFRRFQQWRRESGKENTTFLSHQWSAGDCCQIDYSGDTLYLNVQVDQYRFEKRAVQIFVAVLPYSRYLFCYATKDQKRESWFEAIIEMLKFFDGVPSRIMFDNSTTMVVEASRHAPVLSQDTEDLAKHYRFSPEAVAPAEPTFKGSVENAVRIIQQKILKPLQSIEFFSIQEINCILRRDLMRVNNAKMRIFDNMSRQELFAIEKNSLKPLPVLAFQLHKPLVRYKAGRNYCIRIRGHSYSVPYRYAGLHVLARVEGGNMLRIYDADSLDLIAEHYYWGEQRNAPGFTHIKDEHRAPNHFSEKQRLQAAQHLIDEMPQFVQLFARKVLARLSQSSDGKKANLLYGFTSLKKQYGADRLNVACARALEVGSSDYQLLKEILKQQKEEKPSREIDNQEVLDFMYENGFLRDAKDFEELAQKALDRSKNHED